MTTTALPEAPVAPVKSPIPPGPRFIVDRAEMLAAIELAASVITRGPKPILQCASIEASSDRIVIRATNLEMSMSSEVRKIQIEATGQCLVKADQLLQVLKNSNSGTITMDATGRKRDGYMIVTDDDSTLNLPLSNPAEFPPDNSGHEADATVTMPLPVIAKTLTRASIFTQKDSTRYAFNGVLLKLEKARIVIAATDGRRMYVDHGPAHCKGVCFAIIPSTAVSRVVKMAGEEITISLSLNRATFTVDSATITTNVVEGQFPPYEDVIPKDSDIRFTVGRESLASCVRKGSVFTTEESKGIKMSFDRKGLRLSSRSPLLGEGDVNCPGRYEGADMEIGVNPKFLLDCLTGETDDVTLEMTASNRPMLISDSTNARIVLMPVTCNDLATGVASVSTAASYPARWTL